MKKMKGILSLVLVLLCMLQFAVPMASADGATLGLSVYKNDGEYKAAVDIEGTSEDESLSVSLKVGGADYSAGMALSSLTNGAELTPPEGYYIEQILMLDEGSDDAAIKTALNEKNNKNGYATPTADGGLEFEAEDITPGSGESTVLNSGFFGGSGNALMVVCLAELPDTVTASYEKGDAYSAITSAFISGSDETVFTGEDPVDYTTDSVSAEALAEASDAGYSFTGWKGQYANGTMPFYIGSGVDIDLSGDVTFTAQWDYTEPEKSYAVTVTAVGKSVIQGDAFPEFGCTIDTNPTIDYAELSIEGIDYKVYDKNGAEVSSASQLVAGEPYTIKPVETGTVTVKDKGSAIKVSGITYVEGPLTVLAPEPVKYTVTFTTANVEMTAGDTAFPAFSTTVSTNPAIENASLSVDGLDHLVFDGTTPVNPGDVEAGKTYTIKANPPIGAVVKNGGEAIAVEGEFQYVAGTLTVKAPQSTTPQSATIIFNDGDADISVPLIDDAHADNTFTGLSTTDALPVAKLSEAAEAEAEAEGFYFTGWLVQYEDGGTPFVMQPEETITLTGNASFLAQWKPILTITAKSPKLDGENYVKDGYTSSGTLASGDAIDSVTIDIDTTTDPTKVTAIPSAAVIKNGSNVVTDNYHIKYVNGTLDKTAAPADPIVLEIKTLDNLDVEYTGYPITATAYEITSGSLSAGHTIVEKKFNGGSTLVTTAPVESSVYDIVIKDGSGNDVTSQYTLNVTAGKVSVVPCDDEVVLTAASDSKDYDGTPLTKDEVTATGLKGTDFLAFSKAEGSATKPSDAGVNSVVKEGADKYVIKNGSTDVTHCYSNIKTVDGKLTINKKAVTVSAPNPKTVVYSGNEVKPGDIAGDITYTSIATGHRPQMSCRFTQNGSAVTAKDAGAYDIELSNVTILDAAGNDVKDCYDITVNNGRLIIKSSANSILLTVTAPSKEFAYDGTPHSYQDASAITVTGLQDNDVVKVEFSDKSVRTDVGTTANAFSKVVVTDKNGNPVEAGKYAINPVAGTLTVKPHTITVTAKGAEKTYDGKALVNKEVTVTALANSKHKIDVKWAVVDSNGKVVNPVNPGTYTKTITSIVITDENGKDVTANYTINKVDGKLVIKQPTDGTVVKTGDGSNIGLWIALLAISAVLVAAIIIVVIKKGRKLPGNEQGFEEELPEDNEDDNSPQ